MACYSGTTVSIARTVTWHTLESFWDDLSGQSPIMQVLREINIREEQVGLAKTTWTGTGADPADGAATAAAKHNAKDGAAWWVQAMDAMLEVLDTGGWIDDDAIQWVIVGVSTIRSTFLAAVGSSSGTRLANAKLEDRWKMILTALRTALDAIDEKTSSAWVGSYVKIQIFCVDSTAVRSGYQNSWDDDAKVQRAPSPGGGDDKLFFDWRQGHGGNSFPGIGTPDDNFDSFEDTSDPPWGSGPGGDERGFGQTSALCVGQNFDFWDDGWADFTPDDYGYFFGDPDVPAELAYWTAFPGGMGWYCLDEFVGDFAIAVSTEAGGTLAPGFELDIEVAFSSAVVVSGITSSWDNGSYSASLDDTDALGNHYMGTRTLSIDSVSIDTAPEADGFNDPEPGNFAATAAEVVLIANGASGDALIWTDGVLSGGTHSTSIRLPTCVDALGRHHLE